MNAIALFLMALALAMDAFAVAICAGLTMKKVTLNKALVIGLYFGIFQGVMPLIGYFMTKLFSDSIVAYNQWIAFVLLSFLGGKMIWGSLKKERRSDREHPVKTCKDTICSGEKRPENKEFSLKHTSMLPLAIATSIDAMVVGVSFATLRVSIVPAVSLIGGVTLIISMVGVKIGNMFGAKYESKAELAGGIVLVLIGLKTLLEHMGVL